MFLFPQRTFRSAAVSVLLCLLTRVVRGTITIVETGEHFASRQDEDYGPTLWKNYPYEGRLQMIEGNFPLCPPENSNNDDQQQPVVPPKKHRLIIPPDGLPVALLARDGTCSRLEKLRYIQNYIEPANKVHFLILDGDTSENHRHHGHHHGAVAPSLGGPFMSEPTVLVQQQQQEAECGDDGCLEKRDETIPIHVLHVSFRSEYKLLDYLSHQSEYSRADGGPRLAIDSKVNVNRISDNIALAIAALTLLAACSCSLGLLMHGNRAGWWEPEPPRPPPPRYNRRRLRRDQVKEMLPVYRFNGRELEIIPEETVPTTTLDEEGRPCEGPPRVPPLLPAELDCCSICLDDYEEGDRIRCIDPCNHTYHAKCIGKWLVERSATCPLCKLDLYESEDEEEEEEEGEGEGGAATGRGGTMPADPENAGITHFQAQLPLNLLGQEPQGEEAAPLRPQFFWPFAAGQSNQEPTEQETPPAAMGEQGETQQQDVARSPRPRRGWWQRLLRRREPVLESLTEPLLEEQPAAQGDVESPPAADEEEAPEPVELAESPSTAETSANAAEASVEVPETSANAAE